MGQSTVDFSGPIAMSDNMSRGEMRVIGFDFGTVTSSISWAVLPHGFAEFPAEVNHLYFDVGVKETPSQIAYDRRKNRWVSGRELTKSIRTLDNPHGIEEENVIKMPKLCLDTSITVQVRDDVQKQLELLGDIMDPVPTYRDVCREFLKHLYQFAVKEIPCFRREKFSQEDYICILSFPATWDWRTCVEFGQIAREAGMTHVDSVSEPEAAAAFVRRNQLQSKQHPDNNSTQSVSDKLCFVDDVNAKMIKPPKLCLIVDAGGGTVVRAHENSTDISTSLNLFSSGSSPV